MTWTIRVILIIGVAFNFFYTVAPDDYANLTEIFEEKAFGASKFKETRLQPLDYGGTYTFNTQFVKEYLELCDTNDETYD